MWSFLASTARLASSSRPSSSRLPAITRTAWRSNSTSPSSSSSSSSETAASPVNTFSTPGSSDTQTKALQALADLAEKNKKSDDDLTWWTKLSSNPTREGSSYNSHLRVPGNQYSGRSLPIDPRSSLAQRYRQLQGQMTRTGVRKELKLAEFYEKPSIRRNRKQSERHRRRFQELVSSDLPVAGRPGAVLDWRGCGEDPGRTQADATDSRKGQVGADNSK